MIKTGCLLMCPPGTLWFFPLPFFFFCSHYRQFVWLCTLCFSLNRTVPFPFYRFIPLIPLSALDVGEATAPALPPTLSLHYSLHTITRLPPTWRHTPRTLLCLVHIKLHACMFVSSFAQFVFALNVWPVLSFAAKSLTYIYVFFPPINLHCL